jgi:hypothetical protein
MVSKKRKQLLKLMEEKAKEELFELLYKLEDYFDYDETDWGKEIGNLINKLQQELLNN